jgi:nitrate/TMAO reductase-like tetraheme cytochrome c subunit
MNRTKLLLIDRAASFFLAVAVILLAGLRASAQNVQHLSMTYEGGMPGSNVVTGVTLVTNAVKVTGVKVTWDGPSGYYQLFESPGTNDPVWVALTRRNILARTATVPARYSNAFFQVSGPSPLYAGSETCAECHAPVLNMEIHTRHAVAFSNALFEADGGQTNNSCLACHTAGFDLPTGFVSQTETPRLASVQCENCHGPAAPHAANPDNPAVRPRAEVASQVCGGCHNGPRHPTFDEWTNSAHALVTNLLVTNFNAANKMLVTNLNLNPASQINHCGRCHSGSVRLSLLETNASPTGDANIGIVCATCHDPHQTNAYPAQLRNPIASTNDYFMPTNGTFAKLYNPEINICAQCHNHAGASWTNNASEPHHSPQYNMLLGTIGESDSGLPPYLPGAHALLVTNQCAGCHMQTTPFVSDAQPATNGHSFKVETYNVCINCHFTTSSPLNEFLMTLLVTTVTNEIASQIQTVKFDLDYWATSTNAPASLSAKYGTLAWEYTKPGGLSSGGPGPDAKEQLLIPENIRKARFNLYVVQNDGTFGIHNPGYAAVLLNTADAWIYEAFGEEPP